VNAKFGADGATGVTCMKVVTAMYQSAREGKSIAIES
jgi:hypothetical protein